VHGTIDSHFRVEWRALAQLTPIVDAWRSLAARAIEPNVFYEPAFALAAQPVFGTDVGAGLIWSRTTPPRLLGFFPARIERWRYGAPSPLLVGWTHPYAPLGTPLVDRDAADAVITGWFDHLANDPTLPQIMLLPFLPTDGPVARGIDAVLERRHGRSALYGLHRRALLAPADARVGYLDRALGHKKRRELRRQRRRLQDSGVVVCETTEKMPDIADALGDFLALEGGGWKGRAGTAAQAHADIRGFLEAAVTGLAGERKARIDRLLVDGRAIAALVTLRSGGIENAAAWAWKIAYDESFARASPGVQVLTEVTQALLDDPNVIRADSCAAAGHPMIDHIWRERLELADRLVCVGPDSGAAFACASTLESLRRGGITAAKAARNLLRR
jgi:hypothetical protein